MVALKFLDVLWLLLFSMWPLFGSCSNSTGADYKCGEEGVQLWVSPGYLGGEVSFQIRDEFGMGYELHGCLSKCLLSTQGPSGESYFYSPYTICLSVQKKDEWLLRVRIVGRTKSEDMDLICPKPKMKRPRGMHHTPRPRSPKTSTLTSDTSWKITPYGTGESTTVPTLPLDAPTIKTLQSTTTSEVKVTAQPTEELRTMVVGTIKDVDSSFDHQTEKSPKRVTSRGPADFVPSTEPSDKLTPSQCIVQTGKITCLNSTVSRDTCLGYRCCHDSTDSISPCYYGHTVTVHCFPDGLFQLILSRYITSPPLQLSSVVLGPGSCPSSTIMGDFLEFKGYLPSCSTRQFLQGRMVYQLSLTAKADVLVSPLGSITRDSSLTILSQCLYNNTMSNISLVVLAQQIPTVTSTGVLSVELHISKEDFPLQIPLRELVFLEVRLLQPSDPRLHLRLHQCWGAPSMDPASTLRWPVISNGCPFSEDDTLTQILPGPVPSSYQRFVVSAFTFVGFSNNTEVYFFCSVSVCVPSSSESCMTDCVNLTRSRRDQPDISLYLVGTSGPLVFQQEKELGMASLQHLTSILPGIGFAVIFLLIMLLLVGTLKVKWHYNVEK